jgi:4-hydroxybenzoate polyprenyltransferase
LAFICFCLVSSCGYLLNDVLDREKDALHPRKKFRPIAAGKISPKFATIVAMLLFLIGIFASYTINMALGLILLIYFVQTAAYSLILKRLVIIDVLIIAMGFMFRAIAGVLVIEEPISSWLIICTIFLSLFLALNKRFAEVTAMGDKAKEVRKTLAQYNPRYLEQMINIVSAACLMSYALYTLDAETIEKFGSRNLIFTLPFVIYGLFRYLYLVQREHLGESPETVILQDKPLFTNIIMYGIAVVVIIYF